MLAHPTTALGKVVDFIFHGSPPSMNPTVCVIDFGDENVFRDLWLKGLESPHPRINGQSHDWSQPDQQILIIGNDPPNDAFARLPESLRGINFRSHFTATYWLAAWRVKFPDAKAAIAVIDPRKPDLATGAARALQTILGARGASNQLLVPGATVLNAPSLTDICQWLKPTKPDERTLAKDAPHLRDLLKATIWNELTSKSEQHHALSNVLGPIILSGTPDSSWEIETKGDGSDAAGQEGKKKEPHPDRPKILLRKLLQACGLVSWEDKKNEGNPQKPTEEPSGSSEAEKKLNILLVDDQADVGWDGWAKEVLGDEVDEIKSLLNPTQLVEAIRKQLIPNVKDDKEDGTFKNRDARFSLQLPGLENAKNPVLLLDLRLFAGKPEVEHKFYKEMLLPLVNHFTDEPNLAWPGFSNGDANSIFNRAKDAVEGKNGRSLEIDSIEHHEVLTWLPRVIALADMSLPTVLFSSTGRRDLVEPFKAYGNIITIFEKPRLNDLAGKEATNSRVAVSHALREAARRARQVLDVRAKCLEIQRLADVPAKASTQKRDSIYVELYIDEGETHTTQDFEVGGIFAVFDGQNNADEFEDTCVTNGLRYFEDSLFQPYSKSLDKYTDNGFTQLKVSNDVFHKAGSWVHFGHVRIRRGRIIGNDHPLSEHENDVRFYRMLETIIEIFCAETLASLKAQFRASKVTFSVYVGTRIVPFNGSGDFSYKGNIEVHRFDHGPMLRGMGERDVLPIVLKGMSLHKSTCSGFKVERAVAVALPYAGQKKWKVDRVIHRPQKEVFRFDQFWDVELPSVTAPQNYCFGKIIRFPKTGRYLFVKVPGFDADVFCAGTHCRDFDSLRLGDPVQLDVRPSATRQDGLDGINVKRATVSALQTWMDSSQHHQVSSRFLGSSDVSDFRPDFRALHYVCDQVLRDPARFANLIPKDGLCGQFDEDYSQALQAALGSSRLLDCGELAGALKSFSVQPPNQHKDQRDSARSLIAKRLWQKLLVCRGEITLDIRTNEPKLFRLPEDACYGQTHA